MKRFMFFITCIGFILSVSTGVFANKEESKFSETLKSKLNNSIILKVNSSRAYKDCKEIYIDNADAAVKPIIIDSRTYVPIKFIGDNFNAEVTWDATNATATVHLGSSTIKFKQGEKVIDINGEKKEIEADVQVINSRTMIPLRAVGDALGKTLVWDDRGIIVLSDNGKLKEEMDKTAFDEIDDIIKASVYRNSYADMRKGDKITVKLEKRIDIYTGRQITKLTDNEYLSSRPYYYERTVTNDNRYAIISRVVGQTNLYKLDMETGEVTQLTDRAAWESTRGVEWPVLTADNNYLYYRYKAEIVRVNMETLEEEKVFKSEYGWWPSHYSVSTDGKFMAVSQSWSKDLVNPYDFDKRWAAMPRSQVVYVNIETKETKVIHDEKHWITHVLMRPYDNNTVLFCHEGPWIETDHRLWLVDSDGTNLRCARPELANEGIGHEYFTDDGSIIAYLHFKDNLGNAAPTIRFLNVETLAETTVSKVSAWNHMHSNADNSLIVGDVMAGNEPFLYLFDVKAGTEEKLCYSGTSGRDEPTHAHPYFAPNGKFVMYTSDEGGKTAVYRVDLEPRYDIPEQKTFKPATVYKCDFESGEAKKFPAMYSNLALSSEQAATGKMSLYVSDRVQMSGGPRISLSDIIEDGGKYKISVKIKLKDGSKPTDVKFTAKTTTGVNSQYIQVGNQLNLVEGEWTTVTATYDNKIPCDNVEVYLDIRDVSASYYFDDFVVDQIGASEAVDELVGEEILKCDLENGKLNGLKARYATMDLTKKNNENYLHIFGRQQIFGGPRIDITKLVESSANYRVRAKIRLKEETKLCNARIYVKLTSGTLERDVAIGADKLINSDDWSELFGKLSIPSSSTKVEVYFNVKDVDAEYYFDDFILEKI